jgi:hypothetical protein
MDIRLPLHLYAETTPGMHPWETIARDLSSFDVAYRLARQEANERKCRVRMGDANATFLREIHPGYQD